MKLRILLLCALYCTITMQSISAQHQDASLENDLKVIHENQPAKTRKTCCVGPRGPVGPAGTFSSAYGQLSIASAQNINILTENVWVAIPFNASGPSFNVNVSTTTPATITVQRSGVYQITFSLYFSAETSDEGTFNPTTYTLGLNINGLTTPVAAVFVNEAGHFSLNFSKIMGLTVHDTIQFYMETSNDGGGDIFSNNTTLEYGGAYLMQISK